MTNDFFSTLDAIRGNGYRGFFSSVFNVEGGEASIADERMAGCDDCYGNAEPSFDCASCGRTKTNFIKFRAGDGDGIYAVLDLCIPGDEPLGGLLIFDRNIVGGMLGMVADGNPQIFDLDFSEAMDGMEGICIGNIELLGDLEEDQNFCLYVGDAGADNSGRYALSYFHADPGKYSVFLFGERQAALVIPTDRISEFGLTEKHNLTDDEIRDFAIGSITDLVMSHMNPAGIDAIAYNVDLNMIDPDNEEESIPNQGAAFISWIFQLNDMAPERVPPYAQVFIDGDYPADEMLAARKEAAAMRGYVIPSGN